MAKADDRLVPRHTHTHTHKKTHTQVGQQHGPQRVEHQQPGAETDQRGATKACRQATEVFRQLARVLVDSMYFCFVFTWATLLDFFVVVNNKGTLWRMGNERERQMNRIRACNVTYWRFFGYMF